MPSAVNGDAGDCCGSVNVKEDEDGDNGRCYVIILSLLIVFVVVVVLVLLLPEGSVALSVSFMFNGSIVCVYIIKSNCLSLFTATRESGEPTRARLVQPKSASITECGAVVVVVV